MAFPFTERQEPCARQSAAETAGKVSIMDTSGRIGEYGDVFTRIERLLDAQAEEMSHVPGGRSGLRVKEYKRNRVVYRTDTGPIEEMLDLLKQIAIELGQWKPDQSSVKAGNKLRERLLAIAKRFRADGLEVPWPLVELEQSCNKPANDEQISADITTRSGRLRKYEEMLNRVHILMDGLAEEMDHVPGARSGLLLRRYKGRHIGYQRDMAPVRVIRKILKQAALELGQWDENGKISEAATAERVRKILEDGRRRCARGDWDKPSCPASQPPPQC